MQRRNNVFILVLSLFFSINCATYKYSLSGYNVPVSFSNEDSSGQRVRSFKIEKKITWVVFDLVTFETFELKDVLGAELPNAKKIYNLKIESEEDFFDSAIRAVTIGLRNWIFWFKPVISRRTIVITGTVVE